MLVLFLVSGLLSSLGLAILAIFDTGDYSRTHYVG